MQCVGTVSFQVLLNGVPQAMISLSPYLFLLCAEGLSTLLTKASLDGRISGVPISHRGYQLSHLFFADNSLLFCRATFS
jgi:hypothetical protein